MRVIGVVVSLALAAIGCGDNITPPGTPGDSNPPASKSPSATSTMGGAQVSHSNSFMLVSSVSNEHAELKKSQSFILKSGVGGD